MMKMTKEMEVSIKKAIKSKPAFEIPETKKGISPPVFVKVDRYKELLEDIQKLRSYTLGLRDALDAMAEIEKEFKTAMGLTNKVLDKVSLLISSLDMKLLRKSGADDSHLPPVKPPEDVEDYVKGIYDQVEKLKGELQSLS